MRIIGSKNSLIFGVRTFDRYCSHYHVNNFNEKYCQVLEVNYHNSSTVETIIDLKKYRPIIVLVCAASDIIIDKLNNHKAFNLA